MGRSKVALFSVQIIEYFCSKPNRYLNKINDDPIRLDHASKVLIVFRMVLREWFLQTAIF